MKGRRQPIVAARTYSCRRGGTVQPLFVTRVTGEGSRRARVYFYANPDGGKNKEEGMSYRGFARAIQKNLPPQ